ncbi:MAG: hypothetical protein M1830_010282 [Pleopsidium flavum]|nr:MAG: hypothetical protein M1830_010282 [Pleopsidium flavum]
MTSEKLPKALLFDIGGVCVVSPFQAILDYETSKNIPPGWVNFSISRSAPNGYWHRLERGEILMDADFFAGFNRDLRNPKLWTEYYPKSKAKPSPPSSAEALAALNASGADSSVRKTPPVPEVDAEALFWEMMRLSRAPDPFMYPALKTLKASRRFLIAALSNTMIFPPSHPYTFPGTRGDLRNQFDVFVSSAHVGLRKPDPRIYERALRDMDEYEKGRGGAGISAEEVVFLDDIGENLKAARKAGMRTIKVILGRSQEAVTELERITGMLLLDDVEKAKL